jgi:hypothetical protein
LSRQFVHSRTLTIKSPATHKTHTFAAEIPEDLQTTIDGLHALGERAPREPEQVAG